MCGITGYWSHGGAHDLAGDLDRAVASLRHRGPNDQGVWLNAGKSVGFGHTRLSILDLSPHGHQPMVSANGRFVMVFNGEVYNFAEIRRSLEPLGHRFRGTGDSEVILAAFQEWGVQAVRRFIGMFAIALFDREAKSLVLLRDRLGVKPLYYGWDGDTFFFGSELKALRAFRHWQPELDRDALADYFRFGYINAPRSVYRNVCKLPPGHWLELPREAGPEVRAYWSVLDAIGTPLQGSEESLAEQLEALMVDAFRLRMISDVPVGVFLSGGVDSSVLAAILKNKVGEDIRTFTIGFNEESYSEAPHARRVAEHLATRHTEHIVQASEAKAILRRWAFLYDEPFFDSSGIPTYLVSEMASRHVKVVLSADGGDELFSGYNSYTSLLGHIEKRDSVPGAVRKLISAVGRVVPLEAIDEMAESMPLPMVLRRILRDRFTWRAYRATSYLFAATHGDMFEESFALWSARRLERLLGSYAPAREKSDTYPGTFADQMSLWDLHNYLPGDILAKVDRATMAVSIEGREPLLDHRLVEFAFRLPLSLRRGTLGTKHLLRKVLYRHVPRALVERPKMGFGIPLEEWLRTDLASLVDEYLDPRSIRDQAILDPRSVAEAVRNFRRGDRFSGNRLWSLLAFQLWREKWG